MEGSSRIIFQSTILGFAWKRRKPQATSFRITPGSSNHDLMNNSLEFCC